LKRTLHDFLEGELLFEHLRTIYRYYLDTGGYERGEMVDELVEYLESDQGRDRLSAELRDEEVELLFLLRLVGGIAPRRWLFRELAARSERSAEAWKHLFWRLRKRHLVFLIGSDTAYLPEGLGDLLGGRISGRPPRLESDVIPGASAVRQSVHGLVIALLNHVHQNPPRVMAEEERIWKRDLEGMADFFHSYLAESGAGGGDSIGTIRGRVGRLVELLRKMGFLEKRGKRLYLHTGNWEEWSERSEVDRHSLFLSFLKDHYENIPVCLESLVEREAAKCRGVGAGIGSSWSVSSPVASLEDGVDGGECCPGGDDRGPAPPHRPLPGPAAPRRPGDRNPDAAGRAAGAEGLLGPKFRV
jgi:hypothetical protein